MSSETRPESPCTVLVVDDERGPREALRMVLGDRYRVLTAGSGPAALETLRAEEVDVVTVDLAMPGMRGDELMRRIRQGWPAVEILIITGCADLRSAAESIRFEISDYLRKPFEPTHVLGAVSRAAERRHSRHRMAGFVRALRHELGEGNEPAPDLLELLLPPSASGASHRDPGPAPAPVETLTRALEAHGDLGGHSRRVAFYANLLTERSGMAAEEREHVRLAALLHDIGKLAVPRTAVLGTRPRSPEELARLADHGRIGGRLVEPLGLPPQVTACVRHHHEHWDGSGVPDGLRGEELGPTARIVAVANTFDTLGRGRSHQPGLGQARALTRLGELAGHELDPEQVAAFLEVARTFVGALELELVADAPITTNPAAETTRKPQGRSSKHVRDSHTASA